MKKFVFNGWYYPSISRSISEYSGSKYFTKIVWVHKIGGWGKFTQYLPYVSIKCLIRKDNKRLYKKFVLDAIHEHPEMKMKKDYYNDKGYTEEPDEDTDNFMWNVYTDRSILPKQLYIGSIEGAYRLTDLIYLQGITEDSNTVSIGFNQKEQKWYGWSHKWKDGFGIGSKVKKGDVAYIPSNKEDYAEKMLRWYGDTDMSESNKINATVSEVTRYGLLGVLVEYDYDNKVTNEKMRGVHSEDFSPYPEKFGKGEWTAKTLDDAKQMALDFAGKV